MNNKNNVMDTQLSYFQCLNLNFGQGRPTLLQNKNVSISIRFNSFMLPNGHELQRNKFQLILAQIR